MPSAWGLILTDPRGSKVTAVTWPVIGSIWKWPIVSSWLLFRGTDWGLVWSWFSSSFPTCAVRSSSPHSAGSASSAVRNSGSEKGSEGEASKLCRVRDWTVEEWDEDTTKLELCVEMWSCHVSWTSITKNFWKINQFPLGFEVKINICKRKKGLTFINTEESVCCYCRV